MVGDEGYADLVRGGGCDVGLAVVAPVDLDEVGPGGDGVVLTQADAARVGRRCGEAGPGSDAGVVAVGTDEVAGAEGLAVGADEVAGGGGFDALNGVLPVEADAEAEGAIEKELMEDGAANASAESCGKAGFGGGLLVEEADATEGVGFDTAKIVIEIEAEVGERAEGVGKEAFAAGLVDRRLHGVNDFDV